MSLKQGKCSLCNNYATLMFSNNPLVAPACTKCVAAQVDLKDLTKADFLCRTYNIPFEPNMWIKAIQTTPKNILETYVKYFLEVHKENLYYTTTTKDIWKEANKEWEKSLTHADLLERISYIKQSFIERGRIKWGMNFDFAELIQLENLFSTTISSFDVNNPMQIDAIKKACKASVMLDKAMVEGMQTGDMKNIKDLTAAHQGFVKMAKIDEMIESAQTDVIRTVADLAQYLEDENFEFTFYDNYDRDIVDKTIKDMKEHLTKVVLESTGLEQTLEQIGQRYKKAEAEKADLQAQQVIPLEEIMEAAKQEYAAEVDGALETQEIMEEEDDAYGEDDF